MTKSYYYLKSFNVYDLLLLVLGDMLRTVIRLSNSEYFSECAIKLMSERDNQISTLSVRGGSVTSIVGLGKITGQECDVDMTGCLYKFCNGSWFPLERREAEVPSDMFRIIHRRDGRKFLHLKVCVDCPLIISKYYN